MGGINRARPMLDVTSRGGIWSFAAGLVVSAVAAAICIATFGFANTGVAEATTERSDPIVADTPDLNTAPQLNKKWVWDLQAKTFDYMWRIPR